MTTNEPSVILFDLNETLIDMTPLKKKIDKLLGSRKGFRIWFEMLLHYSLVDNCTNQYHNFPSIALATLGMTAKSLKKNIEEKEMKAALALLKKLKAHKDVRKGLTLLKKNGFRLATLTNSPSSTLIEQLNNSRLSEYFEQALSVDAIKKYKPAPETYKWAAEQLSVSPHEIIMVAAHGCDIAGAIEAGLQTAFIEREGQSLYPLSAKPSFMGTNLIEVAKAFINKNKI